MINNKLLRRRERLGLSINNISNYLDVDVNNFAYREKSGCPIEPEFFARWIRYLKLTLPFLCNEDEGEYCFPIVLQTKYERASFKENFIADNGKISTFNISFKYNKYDDLENLVAANLFIPEFPIFKDKILIIQKINSLNDAVNANSRLYKKVDNDIDWKLVYIFAADKNHKNIRMFEIKDYDFQTDEYIVVDKENGEPERIDERMIKPIYVVIDCFCDVTNTLPQTKLIYKKFIKK